MDWNGVRVFLTGHTGFKGSWLALWLADLGAEVTGYALPAPTEPSLFETARIADRVTHIVGDIRDLEAVKAAMAAARMDLPSVILYGGSIMPGNLHGKAITIQDVFEAVGACAAGLMTEAELREIEATACPGEGACGGMFTANTMSSIAEAIGMSLPGTASPPAIDGRREGDAERAGAAVVNLLRLGITPRQIMTKKAFENAIAVVMALGGSTNAVLHLTAIAIEAGIEAGRPYRVRVTHFAEQVAEAGFTEVERLQRQEADHPDRRYAAIAARAV